MVLKKYFSNTKHNKLIKIKLFITYIILSNYALIKTSLINKRNWSNGYNRYASTRS